MRRTRYASLALCLAATLLSAEAIHASSPSLSIIMPRGVKRGAETVMTFSGARLADGEEIFFYEKGFTVKKIEANGANQLKVTVSVAADARLGEHTAQVRTKSGISEYRTFYVGPFAETAEKEPNSEFTAPQAVSLNTTVVGVVTSEDVDYYVVDVKKGQRVSAEVEGMRLGTTLFDPYVAILDAKRFELSSADDSPLVYQDAVASIVAPADGKYYVEVRESAYGGNGNCRYRLHLGTFPRPTAVYPAGGKIGTEIEVKFLGDPSGILTQKFKLPAQLEEGYGVIAKDASGMAPSENVFRLYEHDNVMEVEPNNDRATATPAQLPLAFNGVIEKPGDNDYFKFTAKKGQQYEVECFARRIRSALDPFMYLYNEKGSQIAASDDSRGPDSYFRFNVPADGEYTIRVRDHLDRGAAEYVYRIEFHQPKPRLTLGIPRVARYSQSRQTIYVARGNRFATLLSASRSGFGGELVLDPKGLPAGIKVVAQPMASNMTVMPIVFEAAADAPLGGALVDFRAKLNDPMKDISGGFRNTADLIRGAPGQSIYWRRNVDKLAVAVIEELPFTLEIVQPKTPLVHNGSKYLKVVAHRKEGFTAAINVQFPFRPPGVNASSSVNIPAGKNEILYPINASASARVGKWPVYMLGSASVNGTAWVASQMAELDIAPAYMLLTLERSAVEQGQVTEIFCKIENKRPFSGSAKVVLLGLPNKVTTPELAITKDTKELVFKITTDKASPAGRHRNVFCRITITENGEPVMHSRIGATELRIDKPLPMPVAKPKAKPKPKVVAKKAPVKVAPKRLTRLEKLRLEAKERREAEKAGSSKK
jgi:hypothetical protein